ncbi:MAG: hypothetical protein M3Y57_00445 [Acidobacteriota bacterium]|nr:hypothetical protein [Acidobacteriota bacterium]
MAKLHAFLLTKTTAGFSEAVKTRLARVGDNPLTGSGPQIVSTELIEDSTDLTSSGKPVPREFPVHDRTTQDNSIKPDLLIFRERSRD